MNIYVASSWRNGWQPAVVRFLRGIGHEVYDFRHPAEGNHGFHWHEIDPNWKEWTSQEYLQALHHPVAERGFRLDINAIKDCDACVMVLPCGKSAHLELGFAAGAGKPTAVLLPTDFPYEVPEGHTGTYAACSSCGDLDGCHLSASSASVRLRNIDPELMIKVADIQLNSRTALQIWLDATASRVRRHRQDFEPYRSRHT